MSQPWTCSECGQSFPVEGYKYAHIGSKACKKLQQEKAKPQQGANPQ